MEEKVIPAEIQDTLEKIRGISATLSGRFVCRDDEIKALWYALVLRQHVVLTGQPGTAKSLLAATFFRHIEGVNVFRTQLMKEMTGDYVFGPMNIKRYKDDGVVEYNTQGMLPDCDVAFLDEFFDANDNVLRAMLECLNERTFSIGRTYKRIPLHSAIATSNFYRDSENKAAVVDRFMFRVKVEPVGSVEAKKVLLKRLCSPEPYDLGMKVTLDEMADLLDFSMSVEIDDVILDAVVLLIDTYCKERNKEYAVSDRRAGWLLDLLRVNALMRDRVVVEIDDLGSLHYGMCHIHTESDDNAFFAALSKVEPACRIKVASQKIAGVVLKKLEEVSLDAKVAKTQAEAESIKNKIGFVEKTNIEEIQDVRIKERMRAAARKILEDIEPLLPKKESVKDFSPAHKTAAALSFLNKLTKDTSDKDDV